MTKLLQLYYTSCPKGMSSVGGAQTYSMSEGLSREERLEIEKYGLYLPPVDLPSEPTREQIEDLFPVAFTFFRLSSGRFGVCRSKYTGQDYSGRWGNYFCHALIMDEGCFPFYPIELFEAPVFRDRLTEEEENRPDTPPPLEFISLSDLKVKGSINFKLLTEFIRNHPSGSALGDMMTALLNQDKSPVQLVLYDRFQNIPAWIGALQMALPVEAAHYITFTTYIIDPRNTSCLVSATSRTGGRWTWGEQAGNGQYYIFDLVDRNFPLLKDRSWFGAAAYGGYFSETETLVAFKEFLEALGFQGLNLELDAAWSLFRLLKQKQDDQDPQSLLAAIRFAEAYGRPELLADLAVKIAPRIDISLFDPFPEELALAAQLLFRAADHGKKDSDIDRAYQFFFQALDCLIFKSDNLPPEAVTEFNDRFLLLARQKATGFVKQATAPDRLELWRTYLKAEADPAQAGLCLSLTIGNLTNLGLPWPSNLENPSFFSFVQDCWSLLFNSGPELALAFRNISGDPIYYAHLTALAAETASGHPEWSTALAAAFNKANLSKPSDWSLEVRKNLVSLGHSDLLFKEFELLLQSASDPGQFFWDYHDRVMVNIESYRRAYFAAAFELFLGSLKPKRRFAECAKALKMSDYLADRPLKNLLIRFERPLNFGSPHQTVQIYLEQADRIKKERHIITSPDVTGLLLLGLNLEKARGASASLDHFWPDPFPRLIGLGKKNYHQYLTWILPLALPLISNPAEHELLLSSLLQPGQEKELAEQYLRDLLQLTVNDTGQEILWRFLSFLLDKNSGASGQALARIRQLLLDKSVKLLARQPRGHLKRMDEQIKGSHEHSHKVWKNLLAKSEQTREKSFFGQISRLLNWGGKNK